MMISGQASLSGLPEAMKPTVHTGMGGVRWPLQGQFPVSIIEMEASASIIVARRHRIL